jgi:hypothetical protein
MQAAAYPVPCPVRAAVQHPSSLPGVPSPGRAADGAGRGQRAARSTGDTAGSCRACGWGARARQAEAVRGHARHQRGLLRRRRPQECRGLRARRSSALHTFRFSCKKEKASVVGQQGMVAAVQLGQAVLPVPELARVPHAAAAVNLQRRRDSPAHGSFAASSH